MCLFFIKAYLLVYAVQKDDDNDADDDADKWVLHTLCVCRSCVSTSALLNSLSDSSA